MEDLAGDGGAPAAGSAAGGAAGIATGYGLALAGLPIVALPAGAGAPDVVIVAVALAISAALAAVYARFGASRRTAWVGAALVAVASLLYAVTPAGVSTAVIAALVGAGAGLCTAGRPWPGRTRDHVLGAAAAIVVLLGTWAIGGRGSALPLVVAAATAVVAVVVRLASSSGARPTTTDPTTTGRTGAGRARRWLIGVAAFGGLALVAWTGTNDPQVTWFGPVSWHGPRDRPEVAITFDDGPNATFTEQIAGILDDHGVKGTFFLVGRAVRARPDVARRLVADGHLVGNHSWHHDYWGWLNPAYPELGSTQAIIGSDVGVCPRFFRPPHGQRTPLMNLEVAQRGMETVTWDVSAGDWATDDAQLVARRVLARVRPGSIILLHDSIDGHVDANRQVIVDALPTILDGLRDKGLDPVRIDELLGGPAYLPDADCAS